MNVSYSFQVSGQTLEEIEEKVMAEGKRFFSKGENFDIVDIDVKAVQQPPSMRVLALLADARIEERP